MNLRGTATALVAATAIISLAGCANLRQPSPKIEYYILEYEPERVEAASPVPALVRVDRFNAAPPYHTTRMIYRELPFSRQAYHYHKWRATPADLTTYFVARDLNRSGVFKGVFPAGTGTGATHVLEGTVDEFHERDHEDHWEAVLTVTVSLLREREPDPSKRLVFQKVYSFSEKCAQKNPRAVAEAMSEAMSKLTSSLVNDIRTALSAID